MLLNNKKNLLIAAMFGSSLSSVCVQAEDLSTVVVSATRSEQSSLTTASNIVVIDRATIEKSAASSVAELLRRHSGLVVSDQFGDGSRVSVGVRGFGETANANTLILVDGRRLNNPDIGSPDLHSISIIDIERIEVVYGSAGVLFGDQAVGGVVNIITRSTAQESRQLELLQGSYARAEARLRLAGKINDDSAYKLVLDRRTADNYRDHNENDYRQAYGLISHNYENGKVFAEWQYARDELETPGPLFADDLAQDRQQVLPQYDGNFSNLKTNVTRVGVNHDVSNDWSIEAELTSRHSDGDFDLGVGPSVQDREVNEFTPRAIGVFDMNGSEMITTVGVDMLSSDYRLSSVFGDQLNDQAMRSFYFQGIVPASEALDVILGARYAEVENELQDVGLFAIYPGGQEVDDDVTVLELGMKYRVNNQLSLTARVEENYRFAKVDEYMQPAFESFSPVILKTQTGISYELGVNWNANDVFVGANIFQLDIDDEIIYDPLNYANVNIDSTSRTGLSVNSNFMVSSDFDMGANASYVDAEVESGVLEGNEVPYVPEVQANIYADYALTEAVNLLLEAEYTGERVLSSDFLNTMDKLPAYTLLNLVAGYQHKNVVIRLRVNNLLDKEYSEFGLSGFNVNTFAFEEAYYPSPERNYTMSVSVKF